MLKEVEVITALETETQPDGTAVISIDAYAGCQLQCPYCFQLNNRTWSHHINIRTNNAQVLKEDLRHIPNPNTELFVGSLSDPYMDIEQKYGLTRSILEVLKDTPYRVYITTKAINGLILRDLELLQSFKTKPIILLGLSHIEEASKAAAHRNIQVAQQLHEAGIQVRVFLTPVLPHIMDVEAMIGAIPPDIPVYLDKLRVFEQGNQNVRLYAWVKAHPPTYTEHYRNILFGADETYYRNLVRQYGQDPRITFMSELWNEA